MVGLDIRGVLCKLTPLLGWKRATLSCGCPEKKVDFCDPNVTVVSLCLLTAIVNYDINYHWAIVN